MKTKLNTLRIALSATTAIASGLLLALPAAAQSLPNAGGATIVTSGLSGGAPGSTTPTFTTTVTDTNAHLRVDLRDNRTIIDWTNGFNLTVENSVTFKDARAITGVTGRTDNIAVLNRDISGNSSYISGLIKSDPNVAVYLINRNSIIFTNYGQVDTGSFTASTLDITNDNDFLNASTSLRFSNPLNGRYINAGDAKFTVKSNRKISGGRLGDLVLISPYIQLGQSSGITKINANGGDVAFVSADDVTVMSDIASPLALKINKGVAGGSGAVITGEVNLTAGNFTAAGAFGGSLFEGSIGITGPIVATGAQATDRGIVLTMGAEAPGVTMATPPSSVVGAAIHPGGAIGVANLRSASNIFVNGANVGVGNIEAARRVEIRGDRIDGYYAIIGGELEFGGVTADFSGKLTSTTGDILFRGPIDVTLRGGIQSARDIVGNSLRSFFSGGDSAFVAGRDLSVTADRVWIDNVETRAGRSIFLSDEVPGATSTYTLHVNNMTADTGNIDVRSRTSVSSYYSKANAGSVTFRGTHVSLLNVSGAAGVNITATDAAGTVAVQEATAGQNADVTITARGSVTNQSYRSDYPKITAGRDITISGSAIVTDFIRAGRNVTLTGGQIRATDIAATAGFVDLASGNVAGAYASANSITAGTYVKAKAPSLQVGNVTALTGDIALTTSNGALYLNNATAGGSLSAVAQGGNLEVRESATALGGDLLFTGDRILLGPGSPRVFKATGAATFRTLVGDFAVFSSATLQSNSDGVGAEALTIESNGSINLSNNVSLLGGTARQSDVQIRNPADASVSLWNVSARNLLSASGTDAFSPGLSRTSTVSLLGTLDLQNTLAVNANSLELGAAGAITVYNGDIDLRSSSNTHIRNRLTASGDVSVRTSQGVLTIQDTGAISGRDVILATPSNFGNFRSADAIVATGHWVIYSAAPTDNAFGGLNSGNTAIWNATIATRAPGTLSGNRYVFAYQPTLTFSTVDFSKIYGTDLTNSTTVPFGVSGYHPGVTGAFLGDTAATAFSGSPLITSAGFAERASVAGGPYSQTIALGSLQSDAGYALALAPTSTGTVTVTPKALNGTVAADDKTYDGNTNATGTVTLNGVLTGDSVGTTTGTFTFADKNAGTDKAVSVSGITLTGTDSGNYTLTIPTTVLADILKKALSGTVTANNKTYDGTTDATGSVSVSGVVTGDDVTFGNLTLRFVDKNAGTGKTVNGTGTLSGADAGNYTIGGLAGQADIARKAITGTVTANDKTYDGTTAGSGSVALSGVLTGDVVNGTATFTFGDKSAGTDKAVTISGGTLSGTDGGNYTLTLPATALADILKKAITGTVTANNKTYDGTTAGSGTVTLNGVVAGDAVTGGATFTFSDKNAGTGKTVTVGGATLGGTDAGNYTITLPASALADILKKAISGTPVVTAKTYDGTTAGSGVVTLNGVVSGDTVGTTGTVFTYADKNAGTGKPVGVGGTTLTGADAGNYTLTVPASVLGDILRKILSGSVQADGKTYDGTTDATGTVTVSGVIAGDDVNTANFSLRFADKNAGAGKTVLADGTLGGADAGNYTLVGVTGQADILKRAITGAVAANGKTYDGTTATSGSVTLNGVLAGDSVTGAATFTFSDKNAGTGKTVTVTGATLAGADGGNYSLTLPATTLADILKKTLTATVSIDGKTYDGTTTGTGTVALSGVVAGDAVGTSGTSFTFADKNAGTGKTVTIAGTTLTGADAGNYTLTVPASAVAAIARRELTITPDALEKDQGDVDPLLTFTITGGSLVNGDQLTGLLGREAGELPGNYAILLGSLDAGSNYQLTLQPGTFAIVARLSDTGELQGLKVVTLPAQIQDLSTPGGGVTVDEQDICGTDQACSAGR